MHSPITTLLCFNSPRGIEVYRGDHEPQIPYQEIESTTSLGRIFERDEIEAAFLKRAQEMGGDALILREPARDVRAPAGWSLYDTFLFEAVVVSYQ
jgi:hypothetical protein